MRTVLEVIKEMGPCSRVKNYIAIGDLDESTTVESILDDRRFLDVTPQEWLIDMLLEGRYRVSFSFIGEINLKPYDTTQQEYDFAGFEPLLPILQQRMEELQDIEDGWEDLQEGMGE